MGVVLHAPGASQDRVGLISPSRVLHSFLSTFLDLLSRSGLPLHYSLSIES